MKAIWSLEVLYLINITLSKVNFLGTRGQEKARGEEHPFKLPVHPDKPTCTSSPWLFYTEASEEWLSAEALIGQTSLDS